MAAASSIGVSLRIYYFLDYIENLLKPPPSERIFRKFVFNLILKSRTCFSTLIVSYILLERFMDSCGAIESDVNRQRLFVTTLMISNKLFEDAGYSNLAWSKFSGLPLSEINRMEIELLTFFGFSIQMNHKEVGEYRHNIESNIPIPRKLKIFSCYPNPKVHIDDFSDSDSDSSINSPA